MATRNIVPRATGEGGLGTSAKRWLSAFIHTVTVAANGLKIAGSSTGLTILASAIADTTDHTVTFPDGAGTVMLNLVEDTTPQLGGDLDLNGKSIDVSDAPAADAWEGEVKTLTAHENVTLGQVCFRNSDGEAALADADGEATMPALYMALGSISANNTGLFLRRGTIHLHTLAPGFTKGGRIYAGSGAASSHTAGAMSQGIPNGSGDQVQVLGVCGSATDVIEWDPSPVLVEVA